MAQSAGSCSSNSSNNRNSLTTLNHFTHPGSAAARPLPPEITENTTASTFICRACAGVYRKSCGDFYGFRRVSADGLQDMRQNGVCTNENDIPESPNVNYCTQLCEDHLSGGNGGRGFRVGDKVKLQPLYIQKGPNSTCLGQPSNNLLGEIMKSSWTASGAERRWIVSCMHEHSPNHGQYTYNESDLQLIEEGSGQPSPPSSIAMAIGHAGSSNPSLPASNHDANSSSNGIQIGSKVRLKQSYRNSGLYPTCMGTVSDNLTGVVIKPGVAGAGAKVWIVRCKDSASPNPGVCSFNESSLVLLQAEVSAVTSSSGNDSGVGVGGGISSTHPKYRSNPAFDFSTTATALGDDQNDLEYERSSDCDSDIESDSDSFVSSDNESTRVRGKDCSGSNNNNNNSNATTTTFSFGTQRIPSFGVIATTDCQGFSKTLDATGGAATATTTVGAAAGAGAAGTAMGHIHIDSNQNQHQNQTYPCRYSLSNKLLDIRTCRDRDLISEREFQQLRIELFRHFLKM